MIYYADIPNKSQNDITTIKTRMLRDNPSKTTRTQKQFDLLHQFVLDKICKTFVQSSSYISLLLCLTLCMTSLSCRY